MYEVGQVLFLVLHKKQQILPVQVIEELVRTTLDGKEVDYTIRIPGETGKTYNLHEVDATPFTSISDVKSYLEEEILKSVNKMIQTALSTAKSEFNYSNSQSKKESINKNDDILVPDLSALSETNVKVELEDGTIANVKM